MNAGLCQYMTPLWVAEALVDRHFSDLTAADLVIEPSCGVGAFLSALRPDVRAVGVEIDVALAQRARENTGREIITGDFRWVDLPQNPTAIIEESLQRRWKEFA